MRSLLLAAAIGAALLLASFSPSIRTGEPALATLSPTEMTIARPGLPAGEAYDAF